jgi:hypothetical protein
MKRLVIVALSALMSVNAFALFSETEPNNTRATADMVLYGNIAPWSDVGVLSLTANDSDFFKIRLNAGDWLTAITFPIANELHSPDTVMALFDASGNTAIVFNDDAGGGSGYGSAIRWQATRQATTSSRLRAITVAVKTVSATTKARLTASRAATS